MLVSLEVFQKLGNLDDVYTHGFADIDYGLRATKNGIRIFQTKESAGMATFNEKWQLENSKLHLANYRQILFSKKGVPITEWLHFTRNHGGTAWPMYFLFRYLKMVIKGFFDKT